MNAKIYTIINRKGGVGKTTTTYNIAASLAMYGKTVLMIDMDEQCSLSEQAGIVSAEDIAQFAGNTTEKLFLNGIDPLDCCFTIDALEKFYYGGKPLEIPLYIIAATPNLATTKAELYRPNHGEGSMKNFIANIQKLRKYFDYIFFDCSPLQDNITISTLLAADEVIIPVKPERASFNIEKVLSDVAAVKLEVYGKMSNPSLTVTGEIATLYRKTVNEHNTYLDMLKQNYNLLGIIPEAAIVAKESYRGLPVVIAHPSALAAKEYIKIAQKLI